MITAMQDLRKDLQETIETAKDALMEIENDSLKTESNNANVLLCADNFTGYFDDANNPIFVGDKLKSEWNYEVIVVKDEDGDYSGKLVCDNNHSCKNIPYALNKGKGYSKIICT